MPNPINNTDDQSPEPVADPIPQGEANSDPRTPPTPEPKSKAEPEERLFTQAEVNEIVQKRLRKVKDATAAVEDLDRLREENSKLLTQNKELLSRLETLTEELSNTQAEKVQISRDSALREALNQANCTDIKVAEKFLRDDLTQNVDGQWCLRTEAGQLLPISAENVARSLPDTLKAPVTKGGAGARGGAPNRKSLPQELQAAIKEAEEARIDINRRRASAESLTRYRLARRRVQELEQAVRRTGAK